MGEMSIIFILNKRYIFSLCGIQKTHINKTSPFYSAYVFMPFSICSYLMQPPIDRRNKMNDLELIRQWRKLDTRTQKEIILVLRQLISAKESKPPVSLQEKALK